MEHIGIKHDGDKPRTDLITWEGLDLIGHERLNSVANHYTDTDVIAAHAARNISSWGRNRAQHLSLLTTAAAEILVCLQFQVTRGAPLKRIGASVDLHGSFAPALLSLGSVLAYGAKKYAPRNWERGIAFSRYIAAAQRHIFAHLSGEVADDETGLPHLAHAACCLMFLLTYLARGRDDADDRAEAPA